MHGALIRLSGATGLAFSRCSWNRPARFPSGLSANSKTCSTRQARTDDRPKVRLQSQPWQVLLGRDRALHSSRFDPRRRWLRIARNSTAIAAGRTSIWRPTTSSDGSSAIAREACRGSSRPRSRPRGQAALRYARQNGIHVSPTSWSTQLIQPCMSDGDPVAD
jgi:hypothetical protein